MTMTLGRLRSRVAVLEDRLERRAADLERRIAELERRTAAPVAVGPVDHVVPEGPTCQSLEPPDQYWDPTDLCWKEHPPR